MEVGKYYAYVDMMNIKDLKFIYIISTKIVDVNNLLWFPRSLSPRKPSDMQLRYNIIQIGKNDIDRYPYLLDLELIYDKEESLFEEYGHVCYKHRYYFMEIEREVFVKRLKKIIKDRKQTIIEAESTIEKTEKILKEHDL
jgi:lysophospholipase L1-like esterase